MLISLYHTANLEQRERRVDFGLWFWGALFQHSGEGMVLEICGLTCCVPPANEKQGAMAEGGEIRSPVTHFLLLGPTSYRFHKVPKQCHHLAPKD